MTCYRVNLLQVNSLRIHNVIVINAVSCYKILEAWLHMIRDRDVRRYQLHYLIMIGSWTMCFPLPVRDVRRFNFSKWYMVLSILSPSEWIHRNLPVLLPIYSAFITIFLYYFQYTTHSIHRNLPELLLIYSAFIAIFLYYLQYTTHSIHRNLPVLLPIHYFQHSSQSSCTTSNILSIHRNLPVLFTIHYSQHSSPSSCSTSNILTASIAIFLFYLQYIHSIHRNLPVLLTIHSHSIHRNLPVLLLIYSAFITIFLYYLQYTLTTFIAIFLYYLQYTLTAFIAIFLYYFQHTTYSIHRYLPVLLTINYYIIHHRNGKKCGLQTSDTIILKPLFKFKPGLHFWWRYTA